MTQVQIPKEHWWPPLSQMQLIQINAGVLAFRALYARTLGLFQGDFGTRPAIDLLPLI